MELIDKTDANFAIQKVLINLGMEAFGKEIYEAVESVPTAYDVDKVVKRIDNEVAGITNMQLIKIDEIVKAGGVNE